MKIISDFINPQNVQAVYSFAPEKKNEPLLSRIYSVAINVFKIASAAALYWFNPSLFAIGVFTGIIFDKQCDHAIMKIKSVWGDNLLESTLITGISCVLSLPVALAAGSVLMGAHFGSLLSLRKQEKFPLPA